ncbi:MAG: molybdopterin-dependent oxidoreductase [Thermodesulfobacteriota bacterium]
MVEKANGEEKWVPTTCYGCFPSCAIQVLKKDGKVVASRGDPTVVSSLGKCCGKSLSRVADLYHPNRLTRPLVRTNPEKGIGVDPQWKEIGWDEAADMVVEKLGKILRDDPRKLVMGSMDMNNYFFQVAFCEAFGSPNALWHGATMCGGGLHTVFFHTLGTINSEPDAPRCNHLVQWGSQYGFGANNNPIAGIRDMAEARKRGARLVVVDPVCSHAAAKADEWIPIIPGTDGALALAVANLLVNDLALYDEMFLRNKTNAPYLVGDDGRYVRDPESGKPFMWDTGGGAALAFDDPAVRDPALEGEYEVHGKACRPAFVLLKEHLKKYPADKVSQITQVPEDTIRRFAREFGEAARIGATIEYEGHILPLRPACIETKRGGTQHKNGFWNVYSIMLSNILVGAMGVPGGLLGTHPKGPFGQWTTTSSEDGLLQTDLCDNLAEIADYYRPYPPQKVGPPESLELRELIPCSAFRASLELFTMNDPERFCIPYKPEALVVWRLNPLMTMLDPKGVAGTLDKMDFILAFSWHLDETDEFADLVIPEAHDFERWWPYPANLPAGFISPGPGPWYGQIFQPIVETPEGVRHWADFMMDVAERMGILPEMNRILNERTGLILSETLCLDKDTKYTVEEVCKRTVCMLTGQETYDPAVFKQSGAVHFYDKTPEEAFPGPFTEARIPVYFEHFIDTGREVEKVTRELGMDWWDTSFYHPMPEWHPCRAHETDDSEYDLHICFSKLPLLSHSITMENPWVDDIAKRNPMDYNVLLHTSVAEKKGIRNGDWVWVESDVTRVKGKVRVTECVHPKVVGAFGIGGRWGREKNVSRGKGVHFNALVRFDWDQVDTLCGQVDYCAKVKVYKA